MKLKLLNVAMIIILLVLSIESNCQQKTNKDVWQDYDAYVNTRMQEWNIPGMAVIVVKGDSVLFQNTYGFADLAHHIKITPHTLFPIGSCTKYFTTTGLSILADEKKLDFNKSVITYYPKLKLRDSTLQKELTVKDILSHRTGLESGDYIWYGSNFSRQQLLDKLVNLHQAAPLRDAFIYNNMMYTLAGTIIEKQSGMEYEQFIHQRILQPLKMNNTYFQLTGTTSQHALPYSFTKGQFQQLPMPLLKGVEPAGGIWSDIEDLKKWLSFHLGKGKVDTMPLLSVKSMARLKMPVMYTGAAMKEDETEYKSYGLGMGFTAYKGNRVMYHTGIAGGYTAHIAFMPEKNIGIMILANTETYSFAMMDNLFDRVLGQEQTDWNTTILKLVKQQWKEDEKTAQEQILKVANAQAINNASDYIGMYNHTYLNPLEIIQKNNKLSVKYNFIQYPMVFEKDNQFLAYDSNVFGDIKLTFNKDIKDKITGVKLELMGEEINYIK